jgi:uncharacterized protein (TIGR03435 family)
VKVEQIEGPSWLEALLGERFRLAAHYDIDLRWTSNPDIEAKGLGTTIPTPPGWPDADLPTALRESLGLKLERRNVQVQFLVIDHIERVPTGN